MTKLAPYRSRRFAAGLLGLLALWFQTVALTISPAAAHQAEGLVICTPNGLEIIDGGNGDERAPLTHHVCICCLAGGCAGFCPPRAWVSVDLIGHWQPAFQATTHDQVVVSLGEKTNRQPRAPPLLT
ncbi:MAG: hypothetical protein AAFW76_04675 [Pseudomonadota bacterium]